MPPGAPPAGTLQKPPRPVSVYARQIQRARQPTGGWKPGDFCMSPSGRLCFVVDLDPHDRLALQYVREDRGAPRRDVVDVTLSPHLCRWLSPRDMQSLRRASTGTSSRGGSDAVA